MHQKLVHGTQSTSLGGGLKTSLQPNIPKTYQHLQTRSEVWYYNNIKVGVPVDARTAYQKKVFVPSSNTSAFRLFFSDIFRPLATASD